MKARKDILFWVIGLTLIAFPIVFLKLGSFSMRLYDESMYAVNVYEMMARGEWLIPYFNDVVDLRNTKPPMSLWLQMGSVSLFGFNESAIRLPAALATLGSLLLVFFFVKRWLGKLTGLLAFGILLTSYGFITFHTGRTGDPDAVLAFFVTLGSLVFMDGIIQNRFDYKHFFVFFVAMGFAFWTKSLQALIIMPAFVVILFLYKDLAKKVLKHKLFWLSIISYGIAVALFIIVRESYQPGFSKLFFGEDAGRVFVEKDNHKQEFLYYFETLFQYLNFYWFPIFIMSITLFFSKNVNKKTRKLLQICSIIVGVQILVLSISTTKLPWYLITVYPFLAIIGALFIKSVITNNSFNTKKWITTTVLVLLFAMPYKYVLGRSQSNSYTAFEITHEAKERWLNEKIKKDTYQNGTKVYTNEYFGSLLFYKYKLKEQNKELIIINNFQSVKKGDKILIDNIDFLEQLELQFEFKILEKKDKIHFIKII